MTGGEQAVNSGRAIRTHGVACHHRGGDWNRTYRDPLHVTRSDVREIRPIHDRGRHAHPQVDERVRGETW